MLDLVVPHGLLLSVLRQAVTDSSELRSHGEENKRNTVVNTVYRGNGASYGKYIRCQKIVSYQGLGRNFRYFGLSHVMSFQELCRINLHEG